MRRLLFYALAFAVAAFLFSSVLSALPVRDISRTTIGTIRDFPWLADPYGFELESAERQGLDRARIDELSDSLADQGTKSFLIVSDDRIVHERYDRYHSARAQHYSASLAKALAGGMALLLAMDNGWISLEDPAWRYIAGWRADPWRSAITIRDLINHTSGIESPSDSGRTGVHFEPWREQWARDPSKRFQIALSVAPVQFQPGARTSYSDPGFVAFAYALAKSLRNAPIPDIKELLRTHLTRPLGIPDAHWRISYGSGYRTPDLTLYLLEGGGRFTARATARLGQLIVNRGRWNGTTLLSPELVDALIDGDLATRGADRPERMPVPVLGWWSNKERTWPDLPEDTLVGAGAGHQVVVVVPSLKLVVVRQGDAFGDSEWGESYWEDLDENLMRPLATIIRS